VRVVSAETDFLDIDIEVDPDAESADFDALADFLIRAARNCPADREELREYVSRSGETSGDIVQKSFSTPAETPATDQSFENAPEIRINK